jgi:hexosaminidase
MLASRLALLALTVLTWSSMASSRARGADVNVIPLPASVTPANGSCTLSASSGVTVTGGSPLLAKQAAALLGISDKTGPDVTIFISQQKSLDGSESYRLSVTPQGIKIDAQDEAGAYYALQTLRQLGSPDAYSGGALGKIPCVTIFDQPRFKWRGMMLDCSRHFFPKEFVEKFIDLMAAHKLNTFHWHLTDDQGWRIEIKRYPKLTEVGAWRRETVIGHNSGKFDGVRHGGFYTQADIREVVAYAAERHITIVPEIEMPGHSKAAVAAYPELGCTGNQVEVGTQWGVEKDILNPYPSTIEFYKNVLSEVADLFPGPYIHIGGDEAVKDQWEANDKIMAQMKELGIPNANALQSWFIRQIAQYLETKHTRLLGWDEVLEGGIENLPADTTIMSWRGTHGGLVAAQHGHDAVMAPTGWTYFDAYQVKDHTKEPLAIGGFIPLSKAYEFDPKLPELTPEQAKHILGGQAQLWAEYLPTTTQVEYMAFPRECALAEALWSPVDKKNFEDFLTRLTVHIDRLSKLNVHFRPLDAAATTRPK